MCACVPGRMPVLSLGCVLCFHNFSQVALVTHLEEDVRQCEISLCAHDVLMMDCAWVVLLGRPMCSTDASVL